VPAKQLLLAFYDKVWATEAVHNHSGFPELVEQQHSLHFSTVDTIEAVHQTLLAIFFPMGTINSLIYGYRYLWLHLNNFLERAQQVPAPPPPLHPLQDSLLQKATAK